MHGTCLRNRLKSFTPPGLAWSYTRDALSQFQQLVSRHAWRRLTAIDVEW